MATFNHLHKERKPGSIGTSIWGVDVKVVNDKSEEVPAGEIGEIAIRGTNVMKGYWNLPEETNSVYRPGPIPGEKVLFTGDLFKKDEEGFLYFIALDILCLKPKQASHYLHIIFYSMMYLLQ